MKFKLPLLAVDNIEVSKKFYKDIFDQDIILDLGKNVTFSGGFAIQQDFAWLTGLSPESVIKKSNNMELYFEVDDFDEFMCLLDRHKEVNIVHSLKKYDWQQRVIRIYDPDYHIIEIGESMKIIAKRYLEKGLSVEQVSEIIQHPVEFVKTCI